MKILFLGDIVGRAAREAVIDELPTLRRDKDIDFVVVNGENSAGGFGITETIYLICPISFSIAQSMCSSTIALTCPRRFCSAPIASVVAGPLPSAIAKLRCHWA